MELIQIEVNTKFVLILKLIQNLREFKFIYILVLKILNVNKKDGTHTQLIESSWNSSKRSVDKRARGRSTKILSKYLGQEWFFSVNKDHKTRFIKICNLLKKMSWSTCLEKIDNERKLLEKAQHAYAKSIGQKRIVDEYAWYEDDN